MVFFVGPDLTFTIRVHDALVEMGLVMQEVEMGFGALAGADADSVVMSFEADGLEMDMVGVA